jgi:putative peptide zinc metalloprotease protein
MASHRPTFSESWSRVAELKPRLRATAQAHRQWFRGRAWRVVRDAASNQHFRISRQGYNFLGRLDGRRTVAQAWRTSVEIDGDDAVTQPEALELLSKLYDANLLATDRPGDARSLLSRRCRRVTREMKGHLQSVLFARIPLFDPDALLTRWRPVVGWLFTPAGLALWVVIVALGLLTLAGRFGALAGEAAGTLEPDNLIWLYLAYVGIKGLHELGHGFACKQFGVAQGGEGEVHAMGIALLIFVPVPYVDASSAWSLRRRSHRIVVSLAGVMTELVCASLAAIVWVSTGPGSLPHALAANVIVLASVSTLIFNGNPLLRYDAYYALSDWLDIPNLWQRSRQQLHALVKRRVFGLRSAESPAATHTEAVTLTAYAVCSGVYRVTLSAAIVLMLAERFFVVGVALAIMGLVLWGVVPVGRFVRYLAVNPEIGRVRARAQLASLGIVLGFLAIVGLIPVPAHVRLEGVVEAGRRQVVRAGVDGFLSGAVETGAAVRSGDTVATLESAELDAELAGASSRAEQSRRRLDAALTSDPSSVGAHLQRIGAIEQRLARLEADRGSLVVSATVDGVWVAPSLGDNLGARIERGRTLGVIASLDDLRVRALADQGAVGALTPLEATLDRDASDRLRIRVAGRPERTYAGAGFSINDAAGPQDEDNPSAGTGFEALAPISQPAGLYPGQRVIVRIELEDATIARQVYTAFRRLIQRRFAV